MRSATLTTAQPDAIFEEARADLNMKVFRESSFIDPTNGLQLAFVRISALMHYWHTD